MSDDEAAFTAYVQARRDAVRQTAYLLCGDWYWADDLAQSAFIRLAGHWRRIRHQEALHAWVRVSLLRAYLSETRRAWRRRVSLWCRPYGFRLLWGSTLTKGCYRVRYRRFR